jgi:hypothetical protein
VAVAFAATSPSVQLLQCLAAAVPPWVAWDSGQVQILLLSSIQCKSALRTVERPDLVEPAAKLLLLLLCHFAIRCRVSRVRKLCALGVCQSLKCLHPYHLPSAQQHEHQQRLPLAVVKLEAIRHTQFGPDGLSKHDGPFDMCQGWVTYNILSCSLLLLAQLWQRDVRKAWHAYYLIVVQSHDWPRGASPGEALVPPLLLATTAMHSWCEVMTQVYEAGEDCEFVVQSRYWHPHRVSLYRHVCMPLWGLDSSGTASNARWCQ